MNNPNTFEEAKTASENMFIENPEVVEETPTETPTETPPATEETMLNEATNVAEQATQLAEQQNAELTKYATENEQLKARNEQLQKTISEMSQANKEEVVEEAMEMPTIDYDELAFADPEVKKKAQQDYASAMAQYIKKDLEKEYSPFVEEAKASRAEKEKNETITALSQVPEFAGIDDMRPQIDHIIATNKWLQSEDMSMEEKIVNAYVMARGVNAVNTPPETKKELTPDELMELYDKNPTFQELIEKKRIESLKGSQQVPPFSASSGAVNVALNIKGEPKTMDEALDRTRNLFGLK